MKQAREDKTAQYARDKGKMIAALKRAKRDGYRVIYIDETMFTRSTVPRSEYCLPNQNMTVNQAWINEPTMAVLSGISREKGQELFMLFPKSVNNEKFQEYLERLRAENGDAKIALFMDNLSCHKSPESMKAMRRLKYRWIFNVAYSPDWNPIESTFSKVKHRFRCLRGQVITGALHCSYEGIINKAFKSLRKKDVVNSVDHVQRLLNL